MLSIPEILEALQQLLTTVWRFLKRHTEGAAHCVPQNALKIISIGTIRLMCTASNGEKSANQLRTELNLPVGVWYIQQILKATPHLKCRKIQKAPFLTAKHKKEWYRHKHLQAVEIIIETKSVF